MASGDEISLKRGGALPQPIELDFTIAHHARIGSAACQILRDKVIDYPRFEFGAQVDDIERKIQLFRNPARILEIVVRAARTPPPRHGRRRPLRSQAHRNADDLVALFTQKRRRDRTVDPARHCDDLVRLRRGLLEPETIRIFHLFRRGIFVHAVNHRSIN